MFRPSTKAAGIVVAFTAMAGSLQGCGSLQNAHADPTASACVGISFDSAVNSSRDGLADGVRVGSQQEKCGLCLLGSKVPQSATEFEALNKLKAECGIELL